VRSIPVSESRARQRIVVVGAGLLGRLLAWRLLRGGHDIILLDRDDPEGRASAGYIAAAMLAPYSEVAVSEPPVFEAGLVALELWPRWLDELAGDDPEGRRVASQRRGSVVVAHRADAASLTHFERLLRHRLSFEGGRVRRLDGAGLAGLEPELVPTFSEGLYLADEGCLDNRALYAALHRAIRALGGTWHHGVEVEQVVPGEARTASGQNHRGDLVIDCRGVGARRDLAGLRGVRGEVMWVQAPEVGLSRPVRLMHPRYQLYIAPRPDHLYVIGATEIESESLAPMTVRSGLELQSALYSIHTGFAEATVLGAHAGLRPAFADNLPRAWLAPGLWQLNGLYRHGYLLGPVLVSAVLERWRRSPGQPELPASALAWVEETA